MNDLIIDIAKEFIITMTLRQIVAALPKLGVLVRAIQRVGEFASARVIHNVLMIPIVAAETTSIEQFYG